jgi:hypothetical protein
VTIQKQDRMVLKWWLFGHKFWTDFKWSDILFSTFKNRTLSHFPAKLVQFTNKRKFFFRYSDPPNTGLVRYLNGPFCLVPGIWIPDHSDSWD